MSPPELDVFKPSARHENEKFHQSQMELGFSVLDFWRWAYSDLVTNTTRGVVAEYLVARALGCADKVSIRAPWNPYDLETRTGTKVEVKSAAYLQRWRQKKLTKVSFNVPETRAEDPDTAVFSQEPPKRQADVYVFALLDHTDKRTLDPLNVDQWRFFVLSTATMNNKLKTKSILSLENLYELGASEVRFGQILSAVEVASLPDKSR